MKIIFSVFFLGMVAVLGRYFYLSKTLREATHSLQPMIIDAARSQGITITEPSVGAVKLKSPNKIVWHALRGNLAFSGFAGVRDSVPQVFSADRLTLSVVDFSTGEVLLELRGAELRLQRSTAEPETAQEDSALALQYVSEEIRSRSLVIRTVSTTVRIGTLSRFAIPDFQRVLHALLPKLQKASLALRNGDAPPDITFSASVEFSLRNKLYESAIEIIQNERSGLITLRADDLRQTKKAFLVPLTEAEIEFLRRNPLRTPAILQVRIRADLWSRQIFSEHLPARENEFKTTYQHVAWSYLLTRELGPGVAKQITDAYVINFPEMTDEAKLAYAINAKIGRLFAEEELSPESLLLKIQADSRVMRIK